MVLGDDVFHQVLLGLVVVPLVEDQVDGGLVVPVAVAIPLVAQVEVTLGLCPGWGDAVLLQGAGHEVAHEEVVHSFGAVHDYQGEVEVGDFLEFLLVCLQKNKQNQNRYLIAKALNRKASISCLCSSVETSGV